MREGHAGRARVIKEIEMKGATERGAGTMVVVTVVVVEAVVQKLSSPICRKIGLNRLAELRVDKFAPVYLPTAVESEKKRKAIVPEMKSDGRWQGAKRRTERKILQVELWKRKRKKKHVDCDCER